MFWSELSFLSDCDLCGHHKLCHFGSEGCERIHEYSWICFWKAFLNIPDQGSPCNLFCFSPCCTMHFTCFMMTYFLHKKNEEISLFQYYVTTSGTVLINSIWYQEHLAISGAVLSDEELGIHYKYIPWTLLPDFFFLGKCKEKSFYPDRMSPRDFIKVQLCEHWCEL